MVIVLIMDKTKLQKAVNRNKENDYFGLT